ncbi:Os08g0496150 [Oryza sativa Japonica Group]|uniref:Os08g0496150 protein n=1 Tax=Oryza sativa subsp. japonica TaxID=39947 RepID=A0A0P0XHR3_ORYSJ|nr:hypothetical protein EE612_045112 [Oryza sativa]BAT06064.1 Os08g0496150 [Oryza sativa Japonica Group]
MFMPYAQPHARRSKFLAIRGFEKLRYLSNLWKVSPQVWIAPLTLPLRSIDQSALRSCWTTISSSRNKTLLSFGKISGR